MHNRDNWDDFRFVLAVTRTGSVSAAGKLLGVNHATVLRRVAAFEERFGVTLFDKTVRGYRVAPGNRRIVEALVEAESALLGVGRAVTGASAPLRGVVRVTSTDTFCTTVLPEIIAEVRLAAPHLHIELVSSNRHVDFARLDADLTVRPSVALPDELQGEIAAQLGFSAYRAIRYAGDRWLGMTGPLARTSAAEWVSREVPSDQIVASADSFLTLRAMVRRGLGRAYLPCILGDGADGLQLCPDRPPDRVVAIWVAGHRDMRDVPRLTAVRDLIRDGLAARAAPLLGSAAEVSS